MEELLANRYVPKMQLKDICAALGIAIRLKTIRTDGSDSRQENFGERTAPAYALGLFEEHYFLIERVPITAYAHEHFYALKETKFTVYRYAGIRAAGSLQHAGRAAAGWGAAGWELHAGGCKVGG